MKSLIISLVLFGAYGTLSAQSSPSENLAATKVAKSERTTETTINGIPYSQYKAQQDALKAKNAVKQEATSPQLSVTAITAEEVKNIRKEEKAADVKSPATKGSN